MDIIKRVLIFFLIPVIALWMPVQTHAASSLALSEANLSNIANYQVGWYKSWGGTYESTSSSVCSILPYIYDGKAKYVILNTSAVTLDINEYDAAGNWLEYTDKLSNGALFQGTAQTAFIHITIRPSKWGTDIADMLQNGLSLDLSDTLYTPVSISAAAITYEHNTKMKNLGAAAFVSGMNVGWNLGNSLDARSDASQRGKEANLSQETAWGNPKVSQALIDYVKACGFNTIRIPVTWYYNSYTDENGTLQINTAWLDRVQQVVDYAISDGLYVIINSHHDQPIFYAGCDAAKMNQVLADAGNLWTEIAERFKTYDEHLIFESYNEIDNLEKSWCYSDTAAAQMNQMNQVFVNAVRASGGNNAKRILMVPTLLDGSNSDFQNAFVMPADIVKDRIVVTVHTYSKKFCQDMESDFQNLETFSERIGAPIIIGEWGTRNSYAPAELRTVQASNYVARAAEHGIKCIWWDNGSDYGIINRKDLASSNTAMLGALLSGAGGTAYEIPNYQIFNQIDQFFIKMPNLSTGAMDTATWGTIVTNAGVAVTPGGTCTLSLKATGAATNLWLQRILFYDASGNYISGKELQSMGILVDIPANAVYARVSVNNPYRSVTLAEFDQYFKAGLLELDVGSFTIGEVRAVQL